MKAPQSQFRSSETGPPDPGLAPLECAAISRNALVTHSHVYFILPGTRVEGALSQKRQAVSRHSGADNLSRRAGLPISLRSVFKRITIQSVFPVVRPRASGIPFGRDKSSKWPPLAFRLKPRKKRLASSLAAASSARCANGSRCRRWMAAERPFPAENTFPFNLG